MTPTLIELSVKEEKHSTLSLVINRVRVKKKKVQKSTLAFTGDETQKPSILVVN